MKQIEDNLLERFKKLVIDHIGVHTCNEDSETFRRALTLHMKDLDITEPQTYLTFLETDTAESRLEWKALSISITIGESYFFRDSGHFFMLKNKIIPDLIKKNKNTRSLRIWSAGCSTGEEPYSIAILLDMLLPDLKNWDISVIGTDINEKSLKKAARGIYLEWSFRKLSKDIQNIYFNKLNKEWEIQDKIKKMVSFQYENLIEDKFFFQNPELKNIDLILCRNVFIYFNKKTVSTVLKKFQRILNYGGYLVTGHAELYEHELKSLNLHPIMLPEGLIYKKTTELELKATAISYLSKYANNIELKKISFDKDSLPLAKLKIVKNSSINPEKNKLYKKNFQAVPIKLAENFSAPGKENFSFLSLAAWAYANSGDFENAVSSSRQAMDVNADSADPYFLLAFVAAVKGNNEEAKSLFKNAIYLEPDFIAAYVELGNLYEKENDNFRAKKSRSAAIEFLKKLPSLSVIKPYEITAGELLEHIENITGAGILSIVPAVEEKNIQ